MASYAIGQPSRSYSQVSELSFAAEHVLEQISYSRGRIGADLPLLLTDDEEQTIRCLFSDILVNIKGDALGERHCFIPTNQIVVLSRHTDISHHGFLPSAQMRCEAS